MARDICIEFGKHLRRLRTQKQMRQIDLAEAAGVSENYVSELELGRKEVCLRTIGALADALGVTVSELTATSR